MRTEFPSIVLLTLALRDSEDVVKARQRARQISQLLTFDAPTQTRVATLVSEIARNAYLYASAGKIIYKIQQTSHASYFAIEVTDKGPGIQNLETILSADHTSSKLSGGLLIARRMADRFHIESQPGKGTAVEIEMLIPAHASPVSPKQIAAIVDELARHRPTSASDEVHQQNQELLHALALLNQVRDELEIRVKERTVQLHTVNESLKQEIVDRQLAEEQLREHQRELAQVARQSSMGEMGSALAHELNQPLTSITTFAQGCIRRLKQGDYPSKEFLSVLQKITEQSKRAGDIIHHMKNFVRKGIVSQELAAINEVINSAIALLAYEVSPSSADMQLQLSPALPLIAIDKIQIEQVLVNLLRNAIEAMLEAKTKQPCIIVRSQQAGNSITVSVQDNGPGFAPGVSDEITKPYFTTKATGMGMGLSISRTIIEAHGGRLKAKSNPTGGALFQFTLPIAKENYL